MNANYCIHCSSNFSNEDEIKIKYEIITYLSYIYFCFQEILDENKKKIDNLAKNKKKLEPILQRFTVNLEKNKNDDSEDIFLNLIDKIADKLKNVADNQLSKFVEVRNTVVVLGMVFT